MGKFYNLGPKPQTLCFGKEWKIVLHQFSAVQVLIKQSTCIHVQAYKNVLNAKVISSHAIRISSILQPHMYTYLKCIFSLRKLYSLAFFWISLTEKKNNKK